MRSLYDNVSIGGLTGPSLNATTGGVVNVTGAVVDTKGYNTAALRVFTTAVAGTASTTLVAVLTESASSTGVYTTALDNTGTAIGFTIAATTPAVVGSARIEGLGLQRLRFFKVQTTTANPSVAFTSVAVIELGRAYENAVPTTPGGTLPPAVSNT